MVSSSLHGQLVVVVVEGVGRSAAHACSAAWKVEFDWAVVVDVVELAPCVAPGVGNVTPCSFRQLR
jgi:hypothetical protein